MTTLNVLIPRQPVPALDVPLLGGGRFQLAVPPAPTFAMPVFYRGLPLATARGEYLGPV